LRVEERRASFSSRVARGDSTGASSSTGATGAGAGAATFSVLVSNNLLGLGGRSRGSGSSNNRSFLGGHLFLDV